MKVLIINGSHRQGNTDIIINEIKKEVLKNQNKVRELVLRKIEIKLPDGCPKCAQAEICPNIKDQFSEEIEPTIRNYDLYIVATPTWDDNVTPLTKIFWDRIVAWSHKDRMYLKDKGLAFVTHGMADKNSWKHVISWGKSISVWEKAVFKDYLTFKSGSKPGEVQVNQDKIKAFVKNLCLK